MSIPAQGAEGAETMTALKHREAELTRAINDASGWGAAVGAMGEELRGVQRRIAALVSPRADSDERTAGEQEPHPFRLAGRPSDDMLTGVAGWLTQMRDAADNLGDQLKASAALYAVSAFLTPAQPAGAVPVNRTDVFKYAAQVLAEIDGLIDTTDGLAGLHRNGDLATWEELLPEGEYERLSSLDMLREALAAANVAGEASPAAGAVPDGLRALSEAATPGPWAATYQEYDDWGVIRTTVENGNGFHPVVCAARVLDDEREQSAARRENRQPRICGANASLIVAAVNRLRDEIASHPAGQSAGSGADTLAATLTEFQRRNGYHKREIEELLMEFGELLLSKVVPAPDSTRTGQGQEERPDGAIHNGREHLRRLGLYGFTANDGHALDCCEDYIGAQQCFEVMAAALAARPAAPEAQGAERVRHVKRGTEYEVLHRGVPLQIAVGTGYSPTGNCLHEDDRLVIYRGSDGKIWAREEREFDDGRFVPAPPTSSGQGGR